MAHYVAELVTTADETGDPQAKANAAEEILRLWAHRSTLKRPYPLENHDRIFAMLDYLGDESAGRRLTRYLGERPPSDDELEVNAYLGAAARLEETVRDVVTWLIIQAAGAAQDREAEWVQVATQLESDEAGGMLRRLDRMIRRSQLATRSHIRKTGGALPDALGAVTETVADEPFDPREVLAERDDPPTDRSLDEGAAETLEDQDTVEPADIVSQTIEEITERDVVVEMLDAAIDTMTRIRDAVQKS